VNIVEAKSPKIKAQARPENIGSSVMGQAPKAVVAAVRIMGLKRVAPLLRMASFKGSPWFKASLINSMRTIEFLTTIPPRAIMAIILVAVKNTGFSKPPMGWLVTRLRTQNPGMIPIIVSGMAIIITSGMEKEPVWMIIRI